MVHLLVNHHHALFVLLFFLPFVFFVSLTPSHHKLSLLWIGSGKATLQSGCLSSSSRHFHWFVVLFVCRTCLESMHIPKLTINLPCKMDYLLMCDLWAPMTYRLNVLLKYYNGEMWMRGNRAERETMTQGSTGGRVGMKGWKREGWVYPLLKRVVRRALLEVLSRLNGATEGNIESITSVSLTYSLLPSPFLPPDSPNISPSAFFSLHPTPFFPYPLSLSPSLTREVITAQLANQINSHLLGCGRPETVTFSGKCHL